MISADERELAEALPDRSPGKVAVAAQLVELALALYRFVRATDGEPYAVPKEGAPIAQPLRGGDSFRKQLAKCFHAETGTVASSGALADSLLVLDGHADDAEQVEIHQRLAPIEGGVLIDLGGPEHSVVEVTVSGWMVRRLRPGDPLFKRSRTMGALPAPISGGTLAALWEVLNVQPADRALLQAWLAANFLPVAQPFVMLRGEQGTGKTTAARMMLTLVDPGPGQMASPPRNERDWGVTANGRIALGLDNLSAIPDWLSDAICRAVTGESMVGRALYTNDEQSILRFRIGLVITSIDPGALRGDLAERMLPIELEPLGDRRCSEQQILEKFEALRPALLGAVLDLVVVALRNLSVVEAPDVGWPRMADFGKVVAALDRECGTDALAGYLQVVADNEVDAVAGDPLADAVKTLVDHENPWVGTSSELLAVLQKDDLPPEMRRGWRTAQELSKTLTKLTKGLRTDGIFIDRRKSGSRRLIRLSKVRTDE